MTEIDNPFGNYSPNLLPRLTALERAGKAFVRFVTHLQSEDETPNTGGSVMLDRELYDKV